MIVIELPFPISVNAMWADGKTRRIKSQRYCDWIFEAGYRLNRQSPPQIKGPVVLSFWFQDNIDKRQRDISNLLKGVEDLLVDHKVIEGDHNKIVRAIHAGWSVSVKGVKIEITSV